MILKIIFTKVFSQFSEKQTIHPINITSIYEVHIFAWLTPSIFRSLIPNSPSWNHEKHVMETWISYDISWWKIMMKNHDFRIVSSIFHPKSSKIIQTSKLSPLGPGRWPPRPGTRIGKPKTSEAARITVPCLDCLAAAGGDRSDRDWRILKEWTEQQISEARIIWDIWYIWYNPNISQ